MEVSATWTMPLLESASAVFVPYWAWAMPHGARKSLLAMLAKTRHPWSYQEQPQFRDDPKILVRLEQTRSVQSQTRDGQWCGHGIQP